MPCVIIARPKQQVRFQCLPPLDHLLNVLVPKKTAKATASTPSSPGKKRLCTDIVPVMPVPVPKQPKRWSPCGVCMEKPSQDSKNMQFS